MKCDGDAQSTCHEEPKCDAKSGKCTNILKSDGASCDDGDKNTLNDVCNGSGKHTLWDLTWRRAWVAQCPYVVRVEYIDLASFCVATDRASLVASLGA